MDHPTKTYWGMAYDFTWTISQLRLTKYCDNESVFGWLVHSWPINIYETLGVTPDIDDR